MILYKDSMPIKSEHIDSMALVRTIRPWRHGSSEENSDTLRRIGTNIRLGLEDEEIHNLLVPISSDETAGRMAYYLAKSLNESGLHALPLNVVDTPELIELIEDNRLQPAPAAVPKMIRHANEYAAMNNARESQARSVGRNALIIVTSEPFILSVANHQEEVNGVPLRDQTYSIEEGGVLPVDLKAFGIHTHDFEV